MPLKLCPACGVILTEQGLSDARCNSCNQPLPAYMLPQPQERSEAHEESRAGEVPTAAPRRKRAFKFDVSIKPDPRGGPEGTLRGEVSEDGLVIADDRVEWLCIKPGMPFEYAERNRFFVEVRRVRWEFAITETWMACDRFAEDLCLFLQERGPLPQRHHYDRPWHIYFPVVTSLGIPVFTICGMLIGGDRAFGYVWGAILGALTFGIVGLCWGIMRATSISVWVRLVLCLLLNAIGYATVIAVFMIAFDEITLPRDRKRGRPKSSDPYRRFEPQFPARRLRSVGSDSKARNEKGNAQSQARSCITSPPLSLNRSFCRTAQDLQRHLQRNCATSHSTGSPPFLTVPE